MKNVQVRRIFWSVFSCIRTEYGDLWSPNTRENTEQKKTSFLDTFHAVQSPASLHGPYFPAPDVTPKLVHVFIFSPGVLVLLLRGDVWKIPCEIGVLLW